MIGKSFLAFTMFAVISLFPPAPLLAAGELHLTKDHLYGLAAFSEAERTGLLQEINKVNPDLPLSDLTRDGSSVRLHSISGGYLEILNNELYSLAVYIPPGIESKISRRSGSAFKVGRILRGEDGVTFFFGSPPKADKKGLAGMLAARSTENEKRHLELPAVAPPPVILQPRKQPGPSVVSHQKKQSHDQVEPVSMVEKPDKIRVSQPTSLSTIARIKENISRQPRVKPLSERVTGVGVAPPVIKRKKAAPRDLELVVMSLGREAPVLDGADSDEAWSGAPRTVFSVPGAKLRIEAAAVTDGTRLYMLFTWPDSDPSSRHLPWAWNKDGNLYERMDVLDDGLAVRWQMGNTTRKDRLEFDLWIWRAGREGTGSYASDAKLVVDDKPFYMASEVQSGTPGSWARIDFDKGRLPFEIVLPSSFSGPEIASYAQCSPEGSASDVRSIGDWSGGRWIVEMSRVLRTGHADDIPFDTKGAYALAVNLLQGKNLNESPASEVLTLRW